MSRKINNWIVILFVLITAVSFKILQPVSQEFINDIDSSIMILIPAGQFDFGLTSQQMQQLYIKYKRGFISPFFINGRNAHTPTYYIDKYEVTNKQFLLFLNRTGYQTVSTIFSKSYALKNPLLPVTKIGWEDAKAFAEWSEKRLPTEEEWEKAAKGIHSRLWPWGDKDVGSNYNGVNQGNYAPVKVGSFPSGQSEYGVMDMAGNVYEMTTGRWIDGSPCMKGGSFLNRGFYTRCSFRWAADDTLNGAAWLGFRCVKDSIKK